jgi:hypothetical protein
MSLIKSEAGSAVGIRNVMMLVQYLPYALLVYCQNVTPAPHLPLVYHPSDAQLPSGDGPDFQEKLIWSFPNDWVR